MRSLEEIFHSQVTSFGIKRDMRVSLEDAAVRATHKVMVELGEEHMKEEWLMSGAMVPVDMETTAALVAEIKRLIDVVGGMALAQSEQDCVGWFGYDTGLRLWFEANKGDDGAIPLYKEPPQRTWVGLTDEEIKEIVGPYGDMPIKGYTRKLFDQIESKLRSKN